MGKCSAEVTEVRFLIGELTTCYVAVNAVGDCPLGVQGWHMKAFPPSRNVVDIMQTDFLDHVLWPQEAPPR